MKGKNVCFMEKSIVLYLEKVSGGVGNNTTVGWQTHRGGVIGICFD